MANPVVLGSITGTLHGESLQADLTPTGWACEDARVEALLDQQAPVVGQSLSQPGFIWDTLAQGARAVNGRVQQGPRSGKLPSGAIG
jgi:hypothetical protein